MAHMVSLDNFALSPISLNPRDDLRDIFPYSFAIPQALQIRPAEFNQSVETMKIGIPHRKIPSFPDPWHVLEKQTPKEADIELPICRCDQSEVGNILGR